MSDKKESSVLFSLQELKSIEKDRQREEVEARQRAEAERIRAQREAEERQRAAERAAIEAKQLEERMARERAEQQAREERMSLEKQERDARTRAQTLLEQQRAAKQMEIHAIAVRKKRPVALKVIAGTLVAATISIGGFIFWQEYQAVQKDKKFKAELLAMREDIAQKELEYDRALGEEDQQFAQLIGAKNEAEKVELEKRYLAKQREAERQAEKLRQLREWEEEKRQRDAERERRIREERKKVKVKCDPNDPLCGIQ
jgi:colicin import membrane protein